MFDSPGFLAEDFMKYLLDRSLKEENSPIFRNKSKFLRVHASSGYKSAIEEMLGSPEIMSRLTNVKAVDEVRALKHFCDMISNDPDRACYSYKEVVRANEQLAIEELLITDQMYRCDNFDERNKYVALMESVKANGGKVYHFSSMHVSGEQLNNFTGIAATLRFPLPDLDLDEDIVPSSSQALAEESTVGHTAVFDEDAELLATIATEGEEDITAFL